jgi:hypothetical protein
MLKFEAEAVFSFTGLQVREAPERTNREGHGDFAGRRIVGGTKETERREHQSLRG